MKTGSSIRTFLIIPGSLLALILTYLGTQTLPTNLVGGFLILFGIGYMVGGAIFLWPENAPLISKADKAILDEAGDRSFWLIIPGFVAVFFASPLEYLYLGGAGRASLAAQIAGLVLICLGIALRIWTRRTIRGQYRGHLQVLAGEPLQTGGPYHYIRHPGYAGFILMSLGIGVGYSSYLCGAAIFFLLLPGLFFRMSVEEDLLVERYGDEYLQYAVRTKRLIPGIL